VLWVLADKFSRHNLRVVLQHLSIGKNAVVKSDSILNLTVSLANENGWPGLTAKLWHEHICIWVILVDPGRDNKLALVFVFRKTLFENCLSTNNKNFSDAVNAIEVLKHQVHVFKNQWFRSALRQRCIDQFELVIRAKNEINPIGKGSSVLRQGFPGFSSHDYCIYLLCPWSPVKNVFGLEKSVQASLLCCSVTQTCHLSNLGEMCEILFYIGPGKATLVSNCPVARVRYDK